MQDRLFSLNFHKKLKKNVEKSFCDFINDLRDDFQNGFETEVVDANFLDQLNDIVHDDVFDHYSPLKFYWLNLVDNLIYVIQLHEELHLHEEGEGDMLADMESELFNFWNDSEFAESFLNFQNEGSSVVQISNKLIPLLENQIISFYVMHLSLYRQDFDDPLVYQAIPEIGDSEKKIYVTDLHLSVPLKKTPDTYPTLPILSTSPDEKKITLLSAEKSLPLKIESAPRPISLEGLDLYILPHCEEGEKKIELFKKNILNALAKIKKGAPHLYDTFKSFTHTIIPINEKGIVSYSMQSLPGFSSLNMFERDSIDLMDDLLHENGHHYLNTFLNHLDLINEDDDKIYYSPWRKALRPIRGIYHATFTFYWAAELFLNLNLAVEKRTLTFSKEEIIKIKTRFLEEYFMLNYCRPDLQHAFENKRINAEGLSLINSIYKNLDLKNKIATRMLEELKSLDLPSFDKINCLKDELKKTRAHYQLV